jgi:hypothetical protein
MAQPFRLTDIGPSKSGVAGSSPAGRAFRRISQRNRHFARSAADSEQRPEQNRWGDTARHWKLAYPDVGRLPTSRSSPPPVGATGTVVDDGNPVRRRNSGSTIRAGPASQHCYPAARCCCAMFKCSSLTIRSTLSESPSARRAFRSSKDLIVRNWLVGATSTTTGL